MTLAKHWDDTGDGCTDGTRHATVYSGNWSGYQINASDVVGGSYFTYVDSTWTVPSVASHPYSACGPTNSDPAPDVSMWTGIDTSNIIQSGTDSCSDSTPTYRFWTEDFPQGTRYEGPHVSGGDTAYVSVEWKGNNTCEYFEENESTGGYADHVHTDCNYHGKYQADYILERVGPNYTQAFATVRDHYTFWQSASSVSGGLTSGNGQRNVMTSNCTSSGTVLVAPGSVSNTDNGFNQVHYADSRVCG